jgi:hypothetical protein
MQIKPTKEQAIKAAIELTPQYAEWIADIGLFGNQTFMSKEIAQIHRHYGGYVQMYDDERKIHRALFLYIMGDQGFKKFHMEVEKLSETEQQAWVESMATSEGNELAEAFSFTHIPSTPEEWQEARDSLQKLPEDERKEAEKRAMYFWCFLFANFFNTLSLMIHGAKLSSLVPQAIAGDDDAYLKAIHIDRMLMLNFPYFRDRKTRAQDEGDRVFLDKIAYRESNPILKSKVRYPALYMLFGILDKYLWLDDLKHREILDICDKAELDRYQNRIETENALTKRLVEYRKWQKLNGVSMH